MKKAREVGVKTILVRGIALFIGAMLAALWLGQILFLDDFYKATKKREIKSAAKSISVMINTGNLSQDKARYIGERYDVCIDVYLMSDNRALSLLSADVLGHCAIHNTDERSKFTIYGQALKNNGVYLEYFAFDPEHGVYYGVDSDQYKSSEEFSLIYAQIEPSSQGDILMIFNSSITPISATVKTFYNLLFCFSVIILVLSVIFAHHLSKKITAPIQRLTESADKFGRGELDADFRVEGYSEAERLSDALAYASSELKKTDRLRRDLIANISHDLRTPITLINGYAEMMRDLPDENNAKNLDNIINESKRLTTLLEDVLDYSRLISGTVSLEKTEYCITHQLREIVSSYSEMLKKDGFILKLDYGCDVNVLGDRQQLGRVLVNFISNAVTHSGEDRVITISQIIENGWVKICIADNGPGIPQSELSVIWERYTKLSRNGGRPSGGSGLGLSIVKAIMELSGGAYGVKSTVGKGSEFWYSMPISSTAHSAF